MGVDEDYYEWYKLVVEVSLSTPDRISGGKGKGVFL